MSSTIRNIMTIAGKELRSYFASPVAWVLMGLFAILFGWFYNVYLNFFVSPMQQQFGAAADEERQQRDDPAASAERERADPFPAADDHDADVLGGKAFGHDRAAPHVARHRRPDHPRQVRRRDRSVRRTARGDVPLRHACSSGLDRRSGSRFSRATSGCFCSARRFISIGLFISSTTKNQMVAGAASFVVLLMFWIISWFADSSGPTDRRHPELPVRHAALR